MKYIVVLVFCLFLGMTGISLGIGTAYPPMSRIAKPVVCPDGEMSYEVHTRHTAPGTTYSSAKWTCDTAGESAPISTVTLSVVAGSVYGFALFVLIAIPLALRKRR